MIKMSRKNLSSQEPRMERSSPCYRLSEFRLFNEMWFLTIDPFIRIPVFIAKLSERQHCRRAFEDFHSQEYIPNSLTYTIASSCVLHFSIGGYDYRKTTRFRQGIHFSIIQVLFADHMQSTTNSRSSSLRVDASKHLFSEGEKNVALSCSFNFNTLLASFHAASRAPCSCHSVSSWDRSSNFGALGLRWWGSPGQIIPSEGFWSRILVWRAIAFVNFTRWIGLCMFMLFRRIDFGGFMSWNTQPNCRALDDRCLEGPRSISLPRFLPGCPGSIVTLIDNGTLIQITLFSIASALLSSFFLDLLVGCSSTWRCAYEHFSPNRQPLLVL